MKKYLLLSLSIIGMISCLPSPQPEAVHPSLPIANIHADYPQKQMDVSTLAEVVYIPLPRKLFVESHTYYNAFHGCISEDWIIPYSAEGDVEIFDHQGMKVGRFNRQGYTDEEYPYIFSLFFEKDNQEIWIQATSQQFKIYGLDGKLKRSITLPHKLNAAAMADYSRDSLLCYDDEWVSDGLNKNPYPFYLLSKKDGGVQKLTSIRVSQRLNNEERFALNLGGVSQVIRYIIETSPMAVCNGKAILADYAKDTVFSYLQGKTTPLFVRKPSVFASLPFILTSIDLMTDQFLLFSFIEKAQAKEHFQRNLLYDFKEEEIYSYQLVNLDFQPTLEVRTNAANGNYPSNWLANEMTTDRFLQYHREGKLKGKAAKVATKIKRTDTSVLILYKFHDVPTNR